MGNRAFVGKAVAANIAEWDVTSPTWTAAAAARAAAEIAQNAILESLLLSEGGVP